MGAAPRVGVGQPLDHDDASLIAACLGGARSAWDSQVKRYARLVHSLINRNRLSNAADDDAFPGVCFSLSRNFEPQSLVQGAATRLGGVCGQLLQAVEQAESRAMRNGWRSR